VYLAVSADSADLAVDETTDVLIQTGLGAKTAKYGFTQGTTWTGSAAESAAGTIQTVTTYYPTRNKKGEGEDEITGDRLDKGDKVAGYGGMGADAAASKPTALCFEDTKLELGAATLAVAGTAALAVALSI